MKRSRLAEGLDDKPDQVLKRLRLKGPLGGVPLRIQIELDTLGSKGTLEDVAFALCDESDSKEFLTLFFKRLTARMKSINDDGRLADWTRAINDWHPVDIGYLASSTGILFSGDQYRKDMHDRLLTRHATIPKEERTKWYDCLDKKMPNHPSSECLVIILAVPDEFYDQTSGDYARDKGAKYLSRLDQLDEWDVRSWMRIVRRSGKGCGCCDFCDEAISIILHDEFFPHERFDRAYFRRIVPEDEITQRERKDSERERKDSERKRKEYQDRERISERLHAESAAKEEAAKAEQAAKEEAAKAEQAAKALGPRAEKMLNRAKELSGDARAKWLRKVIEQCPGVSHGVEAFKVP
jgi:hypothetical protein